MKHRLLALLAFAAMIGTSYSHCEIPCGIYGDQMRIAALAEDITTVEKSIQQIQALSKEGDKNYNQLVRWVVNKEEHATRIQTVVFQYFMAQRIKPVSPDDKDGYARYLQQLTLAHQLMVQAMKAKQGTDLETVKQMRETLAAFEAAYFTEADKAHKH